MINSSSWIIDSRATDHVIDLHTFFLTYSTCSSRDKLTCRRIIIFHIREGINFSSMPLYSVLDVPNFYRNRLSISNITKTVKLLQNFLPYSLYFSGTRNGESDWQWYNAWWSLCFRMRSSSKAFPIKLCYRNREQLVFFINFTSGIDA